MSQYDSLERRQRENARNAPLLRRSFNRRKKKYRMDFSPLRDEDEAGQRNSRNNNRSTEGRRHGGRLHVRTSAATRRALSPEQQASENVRNARRVILSGSRAKKQMHKRGLLRTIDFNQGSIDLSGSEDEGRQRTRRSPSPARSSRRTRGGSDHGERSRRQHSPASQSPVRSSRRTRGGSDHGERSRRQHSPASRSPARNSRRTRRGSDHSDRSEDESCSRSPSSHRSRAAAARRNRRNNGRPSLDHLSSPRRDLELPMRPSLSPTSSSRHRRSPALHNIDFAVNYDSSDSESEVSLRSPINHKRSKAHFDVSSFGITYESDNEAVEDEDWRSQSRLLRGLRT